MKDFHEWYGLARSLSDGIREVLYAELKRTGFAGWSRRKDMKGAHKVDRLANELLRSALRSRPCNLFLESGRPVLRKGAEFSLFIDPVDGSRNWDLGIGDPAIVIAAAPKAEEVSFADLGFVYVEGLRSGDRYYLKDGEVCFYSPRLQRQWTIPALKPAAKKVSEATIYLRHGYSLARPQLERCLPLLRTCKDTRAVENTGMELCEVARDAAQGLVETRGGSDHFNLLAYPIVKSVGGLVTDLEGKDIGHLIIDPQGKQDFIACTNRHLLRDILRLINSAA